MKVREICCGLLLAASASRLGAGEQMAMKVSPEVAFAPADLVVRTSIEANPDNRALEVIIDSPDFYRSSLIELEGELAPRTTIFEIRNLPGGEYVVTSRLVGPTGQTRSALRQTVTVMAADKVR